LRKKTTEDQTHIRIFKSDKRALDLFMKKRKIKSQAKAVRLLIRRKR